MDLPSLMHFLNALLMIAIPILLGIFLVNRFHFGGRIWLIGACTFVVSQVLHIPFNLVLLNPQLARLREALPGVQGLLIISASLGLSAGIFEETARYAMYRWWIKDSHTWRNGILAGAGHGGIEAIILGILVLLGYFNMVAYRNVDLSNFFPRLDQLQIATQQLSAYWNAPWYAALLGAVERMFTIPFHIAASVLVLQVFTRRQGHQRLAWLGLAILYHAIVDAGVVFISQQLGMYIAEAVLGGLAVVDVVIIFALRHPEPEPETGIPSPMAQQPPVFTPTPVEETSDNLEKTRFQ